MIYTVTFNPSIDYMIRLDEFHSGAVNRSNAEHIFCGGKGVNVSIVLKNLGVPSTALGFIAGFTGQEIENQLQRIGCKSDFIKLADGLSRINIKLKALEESEINGRGPNIPQAAIDRLFERLARLTAGDMLILAGSIPQTLPDDIYEKIMAFLQNRDIKIIVDATCDLLLNVLKYKPFLIKPNNHELGEMFGVALKTDEEIIAYAKKLQERGAQNVLISMAGDGALLLTDDGTVYRSPAPKGIVVNSVGAGDSMVAGFITGWIKTSRLAYSFKMGVAAGSASAFSASLATRQEVEDLLQTIHTKITH